MVYRSVGIKPMTIAILIEYCIRCRIHTSDRCVSIAGINLSAALIGGIRIISANINTALHWSYGVKGSCTYAVVPDNL